MQIWRKKKTEKGWDKFYLKDTINPTGLVPVLLNIVFRKTGNYVIVFGEKEEISLRELAKTLLGEDSSVDKLLAMVVEQIRKHTVADLCVTAVYSSTALVSPEQEINEPQRWAILVRDK